MTIFNTELTQENRQLPLTVQVEGQGDGNVVIYVTDRNGEYWTLGTLRDDGTFMLDNGIEDERIKTNERGEILVFSDAADKALNADKKSRSKKGA